MDQSLEEEDKAWRTVRRPSDMVRFNLFFRLLSFVAEHVL